MSVNKSIYDEKEYRYDTNIMAVAIFVTRVVIETSKGRDFHV